MTTETDTPSVMKKSSKAHKNAYDAPNPIDQGFVDISGLFKQTNVPPVVNSILQRKGNVSGYVDTSRHFIEQNVNPDDLSVSTSIVKHNKFPSTQAVAIVSKQKMISTEIFRPARTENVTDIVSTARNQGIATVSGNKSLSKVKKKQNKNPFGDSPIFDADYVDMESSGKYKVSRVSRKLSEALRKASKEDDIVRITGAEESSRKFRKAPAKDAQDLGLAQRSKSPEHSAISAISDAKTKTKESLKKRPIKQVTATDAFDFLVDQFRGKPVKKDQTSPKKRHCLKSNIVHAVQNVNEIMEEVGKNPNLQRIKQQQEADIKGLRSANRHLKGSIAACANSKKEITAGSLVTQRTLVTNNSTTTTAANAVSSSNPYGITARFEKGLGDHRIELHYYYGHKRITHAQVERVLTKKQIHNLKNEAKNFIFGRQMPAFTNAASPTVAQANQTVNTTTLGNQGTKRTIIRTKVATASGLARKTHSKVV